MKLIVSLLLLSASVCYGQIADIDMIALQQFKLRQNQNLERFKQDQENALAVVMQQQVLVHLLEQVEHQKALVIQLGPIDKQSITTVITDANVQNKQKAAPL